MKNRKLILKIVVVFIFLYINILMSFAYSKNSELLKEIDKSIPSVLNYKTEFYEETYKQYIEKKEKEILKKANPKEKIIRIVNFSDLMDPFILKKLSHGKKNSESRMIDLMKANTIKEANELAFPVYPYYVDWLKIDTTKNLLKFYTYSFFLGNVKIFKKGQIKIDYSKISNIFFSEYKNNYTFSYNPSKSDYLSLVTIISKNNCKSFWIQGLKEMGYYYKAKNPKNFGEGYSGNHDSYLKEKLLNNYDEYDKNIAKISYLINIVYDKILINRYDSLIDQLYRNF